MKFLWLFSSCVVVAKALDVNSASIPANVLTSALGPETPSSVNNVESAPPVIGSNAPVAAAVASRIRSAVESNAAPQLKSAPNSVPMLPSAFGATDVSKPKVADAFVPHLFQFTPTPLREKCADIVEEMQNNEATMSAHVQLVVILGCLDGSAFSSPHQAVNLDKNAASSFGTLYSEMVNESGERAGGDLIHFMDRLIGCHTNDGYTILQKLLKKGMEKSLVTPFVLDLLRGTNSYDPALMTDANGNNLMHLAVSSGGWNVPRTLFNLELKKNFGDPSRKMNGVFWLLSSLLARNHDGKQPLDLATTNIRDRLKRTFRAHAQYLFIKAAEYGIQDDIKNIQKDFNNAMDTSQAAPVGY